MAEMLGADALPVMLQKHHVVDLSQPMEVGMPSFPTQSRYFHDLWNSYWHGETSVSYQIIMNEHSGTHVDAPAHSIVDGHPHHTWVDAMPLESLIDRILENLTNIDALPPFCTFVALPLKIASGSGSPLRPVAFVPKGRHD